MKNRVLVLVALLAAVFFVPQQGFSQTVNNPNRNAVTGVPTVRRLFDLASTRRIDFGLIGDSNIRIGPGSTGVPGQSSGHEHFMAKAFAARFGMYATRVEPCGATGGWGSIEQGTVSWNCTPFGGNFPPDVNAVAYPSTLTCFPGNFEVLQDGLTAPTNYNCGMAINYDLPIDITGALRYHLTHYITASSSPGYIGLSAREGFPGNYTHTYASWGGPIATTGATASFADIAMDIPAGPRAASGIMIVPVDYSTNTGARGPSMRLWQRVEAPSVMHGISYDLMWAQGAKSGRYTLETLQVPGIQAPMQEWFRQVTRLQNAPAVLCVHLMHGGNDHNDHYPSLGPIGGLDSSTGPGYQDNMLGIIQIVRSWWTLAGNDPSNLFFIIGPYHPLAGNPGVIQLPFEQVGRDMAAADPQIIAIAGHNLSTSAEFLANGYLLNGNDPSHLSPLGYEVWARTMVRAMDLALCPADYNNSHTLELDDVFGFLNAWFDANINTDFNHSGALENQDIFDFLNSWFAGCGA